MTITRIKAPKERERQWSFYRLSDGIFTGVRLTATNADVVKTNTPEGCAAKVGRFDPRSQRVDLETGKVVEYEAPPDPQRDRDRIHARIVALERKQHRRVRELLAESDPQLKSIDAEIQELRAQL